MQSPGSGRPSDDGLLGFQGEFKAGNNRVGRRRSGIGSRKGKGPATAGRTDPTPDRRFPVQIALGRKPEGDNGFSSMKISIFAETKQKECETEDYVEMADGPLYETGGDGPDAGRRRPVYGNL